MVKVEQEAHFLYNDDELTEYVGEGDVAKNKDYVEFYEAREIEKIIDRINKLGVDMEEYDVSGEEPKGKRGSGKESIKPIYTVKTEKENNGFFSLEEVLRFVKSVGKEGMSIQRYKGLGEMNPSQLWETTMDPEKRTLLKVTLEDAVEADSMFTILMGEAVEPRREFIEKHAHEVKVLDV
jgi:DNA gyrase subunit B